MGRAVKEQSMQRGKGFTLLEIVIAMGILLLILSFLGVIIPYSRTRMQNTSHQDLAASWAEDKVDEIRALSWTDIESTYLNRDVYDNFSTDFEAGMEGAGDSQNRIHHVAFNRCVRAETETDIYGTSMPDMIKVSVLIYWEEAMRSNAGAAAVRQYREYRLTTKVYRWQ